MSKRRLDEIASAVGLAAYVLVLLAAWEVWRFTNWLGWGVPYELLSFPSVLAALVVSPASDWARSVAERQARRSTKDS